MKQSAFHLLILGSLLLCDSLSAALVSFEINGQINGTGTVWDGTALTGTVSYEDTAVGSTPTVILPPNASISVAALGQTFTHDDDLDALAFGFLTVVPAAFTTSGQDELALTLIVGEFGGANPVAINAKEISKLEINLAPTRVGQSTYSVDVVATVAAVADVRLDLSVSGFVPTLSWMLLDGLGVAAQAAVEVHRMDPRVRTWVKIADLQAGTVSYSDMTSNGAALYRILAKGQ